VSPRMALYEQYRQTLWGMKSHMGLTNVAI